MFNLIKFSKNRRGEVVMEINPPEISLKKIFKFFAIFLISVFNPIFNFFDSLAENRKLVISAVGLGIGLGLSIVTTQRPDILQAFGSGEKINRLVSVSSLSIPNLNYYSAVNILEEDSLVSNVFSNKIFQLSKFGSLSSVTPIVITSFNQTSLIPLDKVVIGDEVKVRGSNKGAYSFRVVEVKEIEAEYLTQVISRYEKALVMYMPLNVLRTRILVVVAR